MSEFNHVGIDLGGTTISTGLFRSGNREPETIVDHDLDQFQAPEEWIRTLLNEDQSLADIPWVIGVPSPVYDRTYIAETPNLPDTWSGESLEQAFRSADLDVRLENDANLAALGEAHHGAGTDVDSLILLTLGTGIGGGIVIGNRLVRGHSGAGAEIGHMTIEPGGRVCGCGDTGCFERYGSASALETTYRDLSEESRSAREIFESSNDNQLAREAIRQTGLYLGRGIADLINLLEPERILFSGGMSRSLNKLLPWIKKSREQHVFAERARDIPMLPAELDQPALAGTLVLAGE